MCKIPLLLDMYVNCSTLLMCFIIGEKKVVNPPFYFVHEIGPDFDQSNLDVKFGPTSDQSNSECASLAK